MSSAISADFNPYTNKPFSARAKATRAKARMLPVSLQLDEIVRTIKDNRIVILTGETGSGKTTQVPQALLGLLADGKAIAVTQNRRFAADMVSSLRLLTRIN
jgi:pre-mRNA-splicing factor ATP-dependent RNA helicase DHX15/PRP43